MAHHPRRTRRKSRRVELNKHIKTALSHAKSGEGSRWSEAREIRLALAEGENLTEYAKLRDGNSTDEQKYRNWVNAVEWYDDALKRHEGELSDLWKAGLVQISYYVEAARHGKLGATIDETIAALQDCVTETGTRGVRWLRMQVSDLAGKPSARERMLKLANTLERAINDEFYGMRGEFVRKIVPLVKTLIFLLRDTNE